MPDDQWTGGSGTGDTPDPYGAAQPGGQPGAQPGQWQQPAVQPGAWEQPGYGYPPVPPAGPPGQWYGAPPAYGQYPYAAPPQRTNGLAIASMVLGILWIWWIGSILALVFGYIARNQIKKRGDGGGGMALAGIILGWIGVGILVLAVVVGFASTSP